MKKIPLTRGLFALVDDADFEALNQFSWHAAKRGQRFYAARREGETGSVFYMHRQILGEPEEDVAHEDGDGLNNRRYNLEAKSRARNLRGVCRKDRRATSRYRGVCWVESEKLWRGQIFIEGKNRYLGRFTGEVAAARAFDKAALEHFGKDAQLNNV